MTFEIIKLALLALRWGPNARGDTDKVGTVKLQLVI